MMDTYALTHLQTSKGLWCWTVNFKRRGRLYQMRFYETATRSSARAHKQAVAWRDRQLASLSPLGKREFCQQQRSNNTSGVPGVHFLRNAKQPLGFWQARLKLTGERTRYKSFSVRSHGHEKAFAMAVAARQQMLAQVKDEPYLYAEVAKRLSRAAVPPASVATSR